LNFLHVLSDLIVAPIPINKHHKSDMTEYTLNLADRSLNVREEACPALEPETANSKEAQQHAYLSYSAGDCAGWTPGSECPVAEDDIRSADLGS
jgi:hypothetical protein